MGVRHHCEVIPWHVLTQQERTTGDRGGQVVLRLLDGLGRQRMEMVRWQRSQEAIYPIREEGCERLFEVESNREVVSREVCRGDEVQSKSINCTELGGAPELPGVVHVGSRFILASV